MPKNRFLGIVTVILTLVFGAFVASPFLIHKPSKPSVLAVSEQAAYIPTNYINIGSPIAAFVLPDGNIWYADNLNGRIVKVSQSGEILRTVGRYGTGEGEFDGTITGIDGDNDGNIYVQTFYHTYKFDFNGGLLLRWGQLGDGPEDYSNPSNVYYDEYSNSIFVTDTIHNRIMKFTKEGLFMSTFGSTGTGNGEFSHPTGITTDSNGRIYVSDGDNGRVEVFTPNGSFLFAFGTPGNGDGELNAPQGIAIKPNGNIVVVSQNSRRIQEYDSSGVWVTAWGEYGLGAWQFNAARSIVQDESGNFIIADWALKSIQKFTSTGVFILGIRNSGYVSGKFSIPEDVAYDSIGNVYVLDGGIRVQKFTNAGTYLTTIIQPPVLGDSVHHMKIKNDQLYITQQNGFIKFDLAGNQLLSVLNFGSGNGQFNEARGVDVDSDGNIYVTDGSNKRVQKFDSNGNYLAQWGSAGTGNNQFGWPECLIIDGSNNIFVADNQDGTNGIELNTRIQVFDTSGAYQRTIGSFGDGDGQLFDIGGFAFDNNGKLHVSEIYYNKIQVFNTDGTYSNKYANTRGSGIEELFEPRGLALNPISGNISIVDMQNHRVQLVPSGTRIYNLINSADVLSNTDNASLVYRYFDPQSSGVDNISSRLFFGDYVVSDFSVNLTNDRDWANVNVLTLPNESKSLVVNLDPTNAPGISASHSLYIVKHSGQTTVHVCPEAAVLSDVSSSCTGGYDLAEGSASLSTVTIGGTTYWKVTGLTGTGIMSVAGTTTPTPTATATATPTTTSTVATTPTVTSTATPTVTTTVRPTTPLIAAVTLPPAIKGETPDCPTFTSYKVSKTLIQKGDKVVFSWMTKNTESVRSTLSEENLPAVGELTLTPEQTVEITFTADNGYCTKKMTSSITVVDTLPWTNTLTIGTGLLLAEAVIAIQQPTLFGNIWLAMAGFVSRKKRQTWGVVYDTSTKKPLGRVVIRLLRENRTVADTVVSAADGTFRLTPKTGNYTVTATLPGYTSPSTVVTADTDGGFNNVYHGQLLTITDTAKGILLSLAMDVATLTDEEKQKLTSKRAMTNIIEFASNLLMLGGFAYGIYVAYMYPHAYNYAILAIYLLIVIGKIALMIPKKTVGTIILSNKKPAADIEIGLFDTEFKNLLYRTFTNKVGEYSFVVPNTTYKLKIMDDRYKILSGRDIVGEVSIETKGTERVRVVTTDLTIQ